MASKEKSTTKTDKTEKTTVEEESVPVDTGKRDGVAEQESAEKSAQELVRERHMSPESFK